MAGSAVAALGGKRRLGLGGDLRGILVEHEVAAIEPDELRVGQIVQIWRLT